MLKIRNLKVVYNDVFLVLKGVSIEVGDGSIVTLLGANGAGKTTTLRATLGVLPIEDGKIEEGVIEFLGEQINGMSPEKIISRGISAVPEGRGIFKELTTLENLRLGTLNRKNFSDLRKEYEKAFKYFPILQQRKDRLAGFLSGGEQQMLAIGRALMGNPKLVMLDEPSLGLAPILVEEIFGIIRVMNQTEKCSIFLIEQNARIALSCCSYGYIMENGRIVMDAPRDILNKDLDIKEFYLGYTDDARRKNYSAVKHYKRRKRWLS